MAFKVLDPELIGDIYHVGTMDISKKFRFSHEGNGLSVSNCPDAWVAITEGFTHGDYFKLSKPDMKLLDYYGLTDAEKQEIQDWAIVNEYVQEGTLYKSISWGEEGEEYFALFDNYDDAFYEADEEEDRVQAVTGLLPLGKLLEQSLVKVELLNVPDIIAELYAEQVLGYDGVYWDEELDVSSYSAPRGVIFNSKLDSFQVINLTKEKENLEMAKTMSLKDKIEEIKAVARELGGELLVEEGDFHDKNHLNCLWYDSGQIGAFVYKGYTCSVEVVGDVSLGVLDEDFDECILEYRKPAVGGAFGVLEVMAVIKDDMTLEKLRNDGRIDFSLNNWVELRVFDENDEEIEDLVFDGMLDGILDDNVLDAMGRLNDFVRVIEGVLEKREAVRSDVVWFQLSQDFCLSVWYVPDDILGDQFQMKLELVGDDGRMGPNCELVHDESYGTADLSYEALCQTLNEVVQDAVYACEQNELDGVNMAGLVDVVFLAKNILREFGLDDEKAVKAQGIVSEVLQVACLRSVESYGSGRLMSEHVKD